MNKNYVENAMTNFNSKFKFKEISILLINALVLLLLYISGLNNLTICISLVTIILDISWILYLRIYKTLTEAKFDKTILDFTKNFKDFFNNLSTYAENCSCQDKDVKEVINIFNKIYINDILKCTVIDYGNTSKCINSFYIVLSENITRRELINIYSSYLEKNISNYIKSNKYTPENFCEAQLFKICKNLISSIMYNQ